MKAQDLLHTLWFPLVCDVKVGVQAGTDNCPVALEDIKIAKHIFDKDIHLLRDKTLQSQPLTVSSDNMATPQQIRKLHNKIISFVDAFFYSEDSNLCCFVQEHQVSNDSSHEQLQIHKLHGSFEESLCRSQQERICYG